MSLRGSASFTRPARYVRRASAASRGPHSAMYQHQELQQELAGTNNSPAQWQRQAVLIATICPLAYVLPASAQTASQASGGNADSFTIPLLLSALLGGAVFAALNDKNAKRILEEQVSGMRQAAVAWIPRSTSALNFLGLSNRSLGVYDKIGNCGRSPWGPMALVHSL